MFTAEASRKFVEIIKEHSDKNVGSANDLKQKIQGCISVNPVVYDEKKISQFLKLRGKTLRDLLQQYIVARMSSNYAIINKSLFELSRYIVVNENKKVISDMTTDDFKEVRESKKRRVTHISSLGNVTMRVVKTKGRKRTRTLKVPLFVHCPIDVASATICKYTTSNYRRITVQAKLPQLPREILLKGKKALGLYFRVVSDIYSDDQVCDIYDNNIGFLKPSLSVIWIPSPSSMSMKVEKIEKKVEAFPRTIDPALILEIGDARFLVGTWDIEEEQPFEHYLREFTTGKTNL